MDFGSILQSGCAARRVQLDSWFRRVNTMVAPMRSVNVVDLRLELFFRRFSN